MLNFPGPYTAEKDAWWRITASNGNAFNAYLIDGPNAGENESEDQRRQRTAELCALLNAGWEAKQKQVKDGTAQTARCPKCNHLNSIGNPRCTWCEEPLGTPESRIARDLGVPVEKLVEIATEEALKCPDGLLPDGETCPRCGGHRAPSGVDGGSWVHFVPGDDPIEETVNRATQQQRVDRTNHR